MRVHRRIIALSFYACEAVSATGASAGGSRPVATEMNRNDRDEEAADDRSADLRGDLVWKDRDGKED